jgi:hypothetical protein
MGIIVKRNLGAVSCYMHHNLQEVRVKCDQQSSLVSCSHKAREEVYVCDGQIKWSDQLILPPMVMAYTKTSMDATKHEHGVDVY